jgi:glutaredoxin-related protein
MGRIELLVYKSRASWQHLGLGGNMRTTLAEEKISTHALTKIEEFHKGIVDEVKAAIATHKIVVVGMAQNPVVKGARKLLNDEGMEFHYMEYGSYMSMWKQRLAIKLWSGWPTFPQIFIDGKLIGGLTDLRKHLGVKKS